jgi:dihydrodipicolinate synthase/N-acetylneuraminate lyase
MSVLQRLSYDDVRGVYAIMPTPSTADADRVDAVFTVDLDETSRAASALVDDGVDAIMINGTFGEAATLTEDEWQQFTRAVVESVDGRVPVVAGPTTLNTRTTIERARFARDVGAQGLLLGRPMWNEMSSDQVFDFVRGVAEAVPELGIVVYNNPAAFKSTLTPALWERLASIPQVVGAKYGMVDLAFREAFLRVGGRIRLMPIEMNWYTAFHWFPEDALACWSSSASCDPLPATRLRDAILGGDLAEAEKLTQRIVTTYEGFFPKGGEREFRIYTIQLEKLRMDAAGYLKAGLCRPPYTTIPEEHAEGARASGVRWRELAVELRSSAGAARAA